jgi:hypothetical protein
MATLNPAVAAAQTVAPQVATQTAIAAAAAGRNEQPRDSQGRNRTGQSVDSQANAVNAKSNSGGSRGRVVDMRV